MWRAMVSVHLLVQFLVALSVLQIEVTHADLANPGCSDTCGDVRIPFPFGMGKGCFHDKWFEIECKPDSPNSSVVKPFLSKFNFEVLEIGLEGKDLHSHQPKVKVGIAPTNSCSLDTQPQFDLRGSPYDFSRLENVFVVEGCSGSATLVNQGKMIMAGCATVCKNGNSAIHTNNCYGVDCCQTPLVSIYGFAYTPFKFYSIDFSNQSKGGQNCLLANIMRSDYVGMVSSSDPPSMFPVVLLWSLPISKSQRDWSNGPHTNCYNEEYNRTSCSCNPGYYGNPYIYNGCQVAPECKGCRGYCSGSWDMEGRLTSSSSACYRDPASHAVIRGLSISFGTILLVIGIVYGFYRSRREIRRRAKFFERNGGLLLQQQLSSIEGVVERTRIFSMSELEKATDHFNENRILGQGGQGTVYKGMLNDGGIVAIKKATLLDESQLEQFINEVVILSQINHRNVVKLMGCCLEMEIPLLVYEFIPNGSLYQYIHDPDEDFAISWEMRLSIAADSARAIAYLHSSSSVPVYHRDIKSSNILLDGKHRAKVSDFGCSKTVAIDQTHLTTVVKGTWGYLDPEYFHTHQFTEKSDVYSFGVVLLELLTSKKPIYKAKRTMEPKNLASQFLFLMKNSGLSHILDHKIVEAAKEQELMVVVELAKRCLSGIGRMRPTMREVATTLETLTKSPNKVPTSYEQGFSDDKFGESFMSETDADFMSNPLPADSVNSMYIDLSPPQPETI